MTTSMHIAEQVDQTIRDFETDSKLSTGDKAVLMTKEDNCELHGVEHPSDAIAIDIAPLIRNPDFA
jgi:hypothetical protein